MNSDAPFPPRECHWHDFATLHLLGGLSPVESQAFVDHVPRCGACAEELELAQKVVARVDLSASEAALDVTAELEATSSTGDARVRERLLERVAREPREAAPAPRELDRSWQRWSDAPAAETVAPGLHNIAAARGDWEPVGIDGIEVKRLSVDASRRYVTMLVRMAPGTSYPGHRHAGAEECYVVSGDLRVGDRVFNAGDYQLANAGSVHGVQSTERGCTLFIISSQDDELV